MMRAFATGLPWNRRLDPLKRRRPFYWHKRYRNRQLNLVRSLLLTKFSDGGGVSICHYCGRAKDGQEAKEVLDEILSLSLAVSLE